MSKEEFVNRLLSYFIQEGKYEIELPTNYRDARTLLRGLINTRLPQPIDEEILKLEDGLLSLELKDKTVADVKDILPIEENICIWQGDITTLKIDAIVNAGNSDLLGCFIPNHSCIDNAIHTYAGIRLRLDCNHIMKGKKLEVGKAIITKAYNLPSKYVIHTVGPMVLGSLTLENIQDLEKCYVACLDLARDNHIKIIAFPCISTGVFRFPKDQASEIAVRTVRSYLENYPDSFEKVVFNVYTEEDKDYYERLFKNK